MWLQHLLGVLQSLCKAREAAPDFRVTWIMAIEAISWVRFPESSYYKRFWGIKRMKGLAYLLMWRSQMVIAILHSLPPPLAVITSVTSEKLAKQQAWSFKQAISSRGQICRTRRRSKNPRFCLKQPDLPQQMKLCLQRQELQKTARFSSAKRELKMLR